MKSVTTVENKSPYEWQSINLTLEYRNGNTVVGHSIETGSFLASHGTMSWNSTSFLSSSSFDALAVTLVPAGASLDGERVANPDFEVEIGDVQRGSDCFVVTACTGDPNHPLVEKYRNFRDKHLAYSLIGRALISCYGHIGPSMASYISNKSAIKRLVYRILLFIGRAIKSPDTQD